MVQVFTAGREADVCNVTSPEDKNTTLLFLPIRAHFSTDAAATGVFPAGDGACTGGATATCTGGPAGNIAKTGFAPGASGGSTTGGPAAVGAGYGCSRELFPAGMKLCVSKLYDFVMACVEAVIVNIGTLRVVNLPVQDNS